MIERERLLELFTYDPETGYFRNRMSRGRAYIGARAGSESGHGYRKISVDYEKFYEHHLAWFYVTGEWPHEIDHVNGDGCDNSFGNLRECSRSENSFNRPNVAGMSGLNGAYLDSRSLQWFSKIQVRGQSIWLGSFNTPEEAHQAYLEAVDRYAGEFAYHNREPQPLAPEAM